ncbi:peptidase family m13 domain-containing protein [Ditylenchus destructor]|uniref:Peptidase family m13 domain-containing protein n=1 Tax=Ditylenchus destructor TaxID=166010 RepID=A0AAD4MU33_9BILA|nr:peptidase family m13 domain-containing protein [Ditylenchus destructor]
MWYCLLILLSTCYSNFVSALYDIPELRSTVNTNLNPCTDFYQFVCDGFIKRNKLRSECGEISNGATRRAAIQSQIQSLLNGKPYLRSRETNVHMRQMYNFYDVCMSSPRNVLMGSDVVLSKLELLSPGPGQKRRFGTEWAIRAFPTTAFFQMFPFIDTRKGRNHPERTIVGIRPKPLITGQTDWTSGQNVLSSRYGIIMRTLLEDDIARAFRHRSRPVLFPFTSYILNGEVAWNCTIGNCQMSAGLRKILEFEAERRVRNLFYVDYTLAHSFDMDPLYDSGPLRTRNYMTISQLNSIFFPRLDWTTYLRTILSPVRHMNGNSEVYISEAGLMQRLVKVMDRLTNQQIADYLDWQILWPFLPQLDQRYTHPYVNIVKIKDTMNVRNRCPLERRMMQMGEKCGKFIEWHFPHLLDRLYIQNYMGKGIKEDVRKIYTKVFTAFQQMLQTCPWIDVTVKRKALGKLATLQEHAVYFDQIFNDAHLNYLYRPYAALRTDVAFAQMVHQLEGVSFLRQLSSSEFYNPSWMANAYYSRENNALVALNGYLQPPIYSPNLPEAMNFAGIGTILGHELSHGFDFWGSFYDAEGRNEDWLGTTMRREFLERKQCFVEQYGRIRIPLESFRTSLPVNGSLTVNENIADNGGIKAAFYAWEMLKRYAKPADQRIFGRVKGLEKYNPDQLFFINYAFRNCAVMGDAWTRQRLLTGQHAVSSARVNVPLQNFDMFAKAFNCPAGSPMNPTHKCAIW